MVPELTRMVYVPDNILGYYDLDQLQLLETVVQQYIQGDCHAVKINDEFVFCTYGELSHRERVLEYVFRQQLCEDSHRHIFVPMLRTNMPFTLEIYMFLLDCFKLTIEYDVDGKFFRVSKFVEDI